MPDDEPDFSDVQGGSSSVSTDQQVDRTYTVRPGDSLSKIAKSLMGDAKTKATEASSLAKIKDLDAQIADLKTKLGK